MKFLSAERHDFGKDLDSINVELSNPNTFIQSLFLLGSFLHGKTIESFDLESGKIVGKDNTFHFIFDVSNNFYFYKYIDILYQRGFLYTDRRLKE
ncbi:hypothetical protein HpCK22_13470 [Helicobacter pylori]